MPLSRIITLTTDFGQGATFVGQMKGRILSICPEARIVDLTHEVPPQDVETGSFLLKTGYAAFPRGTIHLAVVDPGVGTERRPIAVLTERYVFLAPDNGLLTDVLDEQPETSAYVIESTHYMAERVSPTFHGRDLFAPAAAWIARGIDPSKLGPPGGELYKLKRRRETPRKGARLRLRVLMVDRFGNATLDLRRHELEPLLPEEGAPGLRLVTPAGEVRTFCRTYAEGVDRGPMLLFNSADHLEVAVYGGDAAEQLGLRVGAEVELLIGS